MTNYLSQPILGRLVFVAILGLGLFLAGTAFADSQTNCINGSCIDFGFISVDLITGERTVRVCNPGGCHLNGWTTTLPGGAVRTTTCDGNGCFVDGYTEVNSDGRITKKVRCLQGGCHTEGSMQVNMAEKEISRDYCTEGNCAAKGWQTIRPNGDLIALIRCNTTSALSCFTSGYLVIDL